MYVTIKAPPARTTLNGIADDVTCHTAHCAKGKRKATIYS
jgi:hypothetical protein